MKDPNPIADAFLQFSRNSRWGTCADCPRDVEKRAYPEFCKNTKRYDHLLDIDLLSHAYKVSES
jgi:hypothetical protein